MEGLLACWALATQEYDLTISYRKGSANGNADTLSCKLTYVYQGTVCNHPVVTKATT